jgi:hypothetical protein
LRSAGGPTKVRGGGSVAEEEEEEEAARLLTACALELRTRRRPRWWSACLYEKF